MSAVIAKIKAFFAAIVAFFQMLFGIGGSSNPPTQEYEHPETSVIDAVVQRNDGAGVYFTLDNETPVKCSLSFCGKKGWRFQSASNGNISDRGAAQLLAYYFNEQDPCVTEAVNVTVSDSNVVMTAADGSSASVFFNPFSIIFTSPSGAVSAVINRLDISDGITTVCGELNKDEAMWGAGEHFDHVNQRGRHVEINAVDKWAQTEGNSYMPIPILVSSRGSGLFMNRFERMTIDVGSSSVKENTWQFRVPDSPCDLFVFTTEKPADVLYAYSLLTGFSPEPAEWNYGTIVCRYSPEFTTLEGVLAMADKMEENDFPWEGVIVEGFDLRNSGKLSELSSAVHGMGKKLMVYTPTGENPFKDDIDTSPLMVRRASDSSINLIPANSSNYEDNPNVSYKHYFDVTSSAAKEYLFTQKWGNAVTAQGIDGAKVDFCELFPDAYELIFEDGTTGGAHHWYPVLFNTLLFNKLNENPAGTMTINRGGGIGAQRYPWIWMGDQKRQFSYLGAQIKGVLSSGFSGVPFTTFDMAGYKVAGKDEADVFRRAVEFTAFTGNIQTHGDVKRPYDFDDTTKAVYRKYAKIHDALRPYLIEQGRISSSTGLPLVRHLAIDHWTDKNVWDIEDEFMLGSKLLIAPVLDKGTSRTVYLPEGEWKNLWTGERYTCKTTIRLNVPVDSIPVFENNAASSDAFELCRDSVVSLYFS